MDCRVYRLAKSSMLEVSYLFEINILKDSTIKLVGFGNCTCILVPDKKSYDRGVASSMLFKLKWLQEEFP